MMTGAADRSPLTSTLLLTKTTIDVWVVGLKRIAEE